MPPIEINGGTVTVFSLILGAVVSGLLALFKLLMTEQAKSYGANDVAWQARCTAMETGWKARYDDLERQTSLRYEEIKHDRDLHRDAREKLQETQGAALVVVRDMVALIKTGVDELAADRAERRGSHEPR